MKSSGDCKLDHESWKKTTKEFEEGSLIGPFLSMEEVIKYLRVDQVRLLPRFPIWEQHGGAEDATCRNIDNGKAGQQNKFIGMTYTNKPADVDVFIGLLRAVMESFPNVKLQGFTSDFKSAYRQCPHNPDDAAGWVLAIWNPETRSIVFAVPSAQLFGCSAAPLNFCRIPDWCAFVAARLFWSPFVHCIDDMISVEPEESVTSSYVCWRTLARCAGWNIPDEKSPWPSEIFRLLGVIINLSGLPGSAPIIHMVEDRILKIINDFEAIKSAKELGSGHSGKLVGQLGFCCSQFYGRWGRAMLRPFYRRQHEETRFRLNPQLWASISWWLVNLKLAPPRPVFASCFPKHMVLSYSDGEGSDAGVGIAAWCPERIGDVPLAGFIEIPDEIRHLWSSQKAKYAETGEMYDIAEIEAVGPLLILHTWPWLLRDALWIHFIDNNGALGALVNGSATVQSQEIITGCTWQLISKLQVLPWFDRVDTASNPVDGLSRKNFSGNWSFRTISFPQTVLELLRVSFS